MKQIYFVVLLFTMHFSTYAQLNNGGLNANFGVDADTRAGYLKYGPTTGTISSDDWFSSSTRVKMVPFPVNLLELIFQQHPG